jgi:hypothetical protein
MLGKMRSSLYLEALQQPIKASQYHSKNVAQIDDLQR